MCFKLKNHALYCYEKELNIFHSKIDSKKVFKKSRCLAGLFHVQKDAGSDDENVVVDDDTAKNGLVNLNVNWRLSCWPLALAALAFEDTSLSL